MQKVFLASILIGALTLNTASAANIIFELNIANSENKFEFGGEYPGGQLGASLVSGDFNNDGFEDIAMGAPYTSLEGKKWTGAVKVVYGGSEPGKFKKMTFLGENSGDQLGTALETGDYNHDGVDDLAIGAFGALYRGKSTGAVYIMNGGDHWGSQSWDFALNKADLQLSGFSEGDGFGLAMLTLDINKDKIDDLLVGAPFSSASGKNKSGMVYGYRGGVNGLSPLYDGLFYGQSEEERFGASMTAGDVNGDKNKDLIIGAYFSSTEDFKYAGKLYIYDGTKMFSRVINKADVEIEGKMDYGWMGFALKTGDVNRDKKDDILVSYFPFSGEREESKVVAYYGWSNFFEERDFFSKKHITRDVEANLEENMLGAFIEVGDFDGDTKDDIVVGAPGIGNPVSTETGDVYIFYGAEKVAKIKGESEDDWFGYSIESLDFNGDGKRDLAIGSRYSEGKDAANNGKTFILLGTGEIWGTEKDVSGEVVNRGEFVKMVVEKYDVKNKKAEYIKKCYDHREFCLFNFLAVTLNDEVKLEPDIVLYPDIGKDHELYESVTIATMLGVMNGYLNEDNSPFHPERPISRIQALKVILASSDLVEPKYKFELVKMFGSLEQFNQQKSYFNDINPRIPYMWWYPMYTNFAVENGLVDLNEEGLFRPDDNITMGELNTLIERTLKLIAKNEETNARGDSSN